MAWGNGKSLEQLLDAVKELREASAKSEAAYERLDAEMTVIKGELALIKTIEHQKVKGMERLISMVTANFDENARGFAGLESRVVTLEAEVAELKAAKKP